MTGADAASRRLLAAATLASALVLAGCASTVDDSEAGFGLPTLDADEAAAALAAAGVDPHELTGALFVEPNGCFTWHSEDADSAWLVWPGDARQDDDEIVLGDGTRLGTGDRLNASGGLVALSDLPDGANRDSYFGAFGGFCDAGERGVVVLVEIAG